jgi:hypothetical protein
MMIVINRRKEIPTLALCFAYPCPLVQGELALSGDVLSDEKRYPERRFHTGESIERIL